MHAPIWIIAATAAAQAAPAATPLRPGTVSVELTTPESPAARQPITEAIQAALSAANFVVLPGAGHSRYVARIAIDRHAQGVVTSKAPPARSGASVGGWGAQAHVALPSSKEAVRGLTITEITVTLLSRDAREAPWTGRALTAQVDGTRDGDPVAVAGKLATAVLARFPAPAVEPITVP